jgi:hypothetical protein
MRITHITHASVLVEADGLRVISDPWWTGPCFGAQWWNYPRPHLEPVTAAPIDYIYISHGHNDHFHPGTLQTLGKSAKVLVSRRIGLASSIRDLGFDVIELDDDDRHRLSERLNARIMRTYGDDTLMVLTDGRETFVNLNDALHAAPEQVQSQFCELIKRDYGRPNYVFCGHGVASHFPNCYRVPGKNYEATAARRQRYFNREWVKLIHTLEPRFGFPFAADVALLEDDLFWSNAPTQNDERPTDVFRTTYPESPTQVFDIAPGFVIADGRVEDAVLRAPWDDERVRVEYEAEIERANRYGTVTRAEVETALALLKENSRLCASYLASYPRDYRLLIRFRNARHGIAVEKEGATISVATVDAGDPQAHYDLTYTTRCPYLRWSLTKPYGDEILFVGSGGVFEYATTADMRDALHRELRTLLVRRTMPPEPRTVSPIRQWVKRFLGRQGRSLYDLEEWTVFDASAVTVPARAVQDRRH